MLSLEMIIHVTFLLLLVLNIGGGFTFRRPERLRTVLQSHHDEELGWAARWQPRLLISFRGRTRNTYGFKNGLESLYSLELSQLLGIRNASARLEQVEHISSKQFYWVHCDGCSVDDLKWAVGRSILAHGLWDVLGSGISHLEAQRATRQMLSVPPKQGPSPAEQSANWSSLTVSKLKDELKKRGLKVSGLKAELVSRLRDFEAAQVGVPISPPCSEEAEWPDGTEKRSNQKQKISTNTMVTGQKTIPQLPHQQRGGNREGAAPPAVRAVVWGRPDLPKATVESLTAPYHALLQEYASMGISKSTTTDLQQGEENYFVVQANAKRDVHSADVSVGIEQVFFARRLAAGPAVGEKMDFEGPTRRPRAGLLGRWALRRWPWAAPTAMEPELAFLMANLAQVGPGEAALDPFCGSCSLLMAAAHCGATDCVGVDFASSFSDNQDLILDNFDCYELKRPFLLPKDMKQFASCSSLRQEYHFQQKFHVVISDPPYCMKESILSTKSSSCSGQEKVEIEEGREVAERFDSESVMGSIYSNVVDLLKLGYQSLKPGGRLVFWYPLRGKRQELGMDVLGPMIESSTHQYRLIAIEQQIFSPHFSRFLVVLEKCL